VAFTTSSDKTKKENFRRVDGEEVLKKIRGFELTSWNFIGHDPKEFRHLWSDGAGLLCRLWPRQRWADRYRDHDQFRGYGGDFNGRGAGAENRTAELKETKAQVAELAARLEALELRQKQSVDITADQRAK
jgi:hypothetical protein